MDIEVDEEDYDIDLNFCDKLPTLQLGQDEKYIEENDLYKEETTKETSEYFSYNFPFVLEDIIKEKTNNLSNGIGEIDDNDKEETGNSIAREETDDIDSKKTKKIDINKSFVTLTVKKMKVHSFFEKKLMKLKFKKKLLMVKKLKKNLLMKIRHCISESSNGSDDLNLPLSSSNNNNTAFSSTDGTNHSNSSDKQIWFNISKTNLDNYKAKKKYRRVRFDNYRTKIKIHFFKFLIDFINDYIKHSLCIKNLKFRKIGHIDIQSSSVKANKSLIFATIREVLNNFSVSEKYRDKEAQNKVSMALLDKRKVSIDFLDMPLMEFFDTIYLSKNIDVLKQKYGLKKGIPFYLFLENLEKEKDFEFINRLKVTAEGFINYYILKKPKPLSIHEKKS